MWRCSSCGYIWDGEESPEECPKCGGGEAKFGQVDPNAMDLIDRARFTNSLHMQLYVLLEQIMDVAEDGIDDNLDPACVRIFKQAMDLSEIMQQSIKAEIQAHTNKGKWG